MTFDEMPTAVRLPFAFGFLFTAFMVDSFIFFTFSECLKREREKKSPHIRKSYRNKKWIIGCEIYCQTFAHLFFFHKIASHSAKNFSHSNLKNIKITELNYS